MSRLLVLSLRLLALRLLIAQCEDFLVGGHPEGVGVLHSGRWTLSRSTAKTGLGTTALACKSTLPWKDHKAHTRRIGPEAPSGPPTAYP